MRLAVLSDVLKAEPPRQGEIELHGRELPKPSDGVHQLDVDLRSIERRLVGNDPGFHAELLQRLEQRSLSETPLVRRPVVFPAGPFIPSRKLDLIFLKTKRAQHLKGEIEAADDFLFDLAGCAKYMG